MLGLSLNSLCSDLNMKLIFENGMKGNHLLLIILTGELYDLKGSNEIISVLI
jgi:hypothetical protein